MSKMMQTSSNIESVKPHFQKPFPLFGVSSVLYRISSHYAWEHGQEKHQEQK